MARIEDCPGFETFGEDVKAAREALNMPRGVLAERVDIDPRYLANVELEQTIPSLPVIEGAIDGAIKLNETEGV